MNADSGPTSTGPVIDKATFLSMQFETLRREIEISRDLRFKIMTGGTAAVPAAQFLSERFSIGAVSLVLPILVVVIAVLFITENNAIMRSGRYIRTVIEPEVPDTLGWEEWLESQEDFDARLVDRLLLMSFYALMTIYFSAAVLFALHFIGQATGLFLQIAAGIAYAVSAIGALAAARARPHSSTKLVTTHRPIRQRRSERKKASGGSR